MLQLAIIFLNFDASQIKEENVLMNSNQSVFLFQSVSQPAIVKRIFHIWSGASEIFSQNENGSITEKVFMAAQKFSSSQNSAFM